MKDNQTQQAEQTQHPQPQTPPSTERLSLSDRIGLIAILVFVWATTQVHNMLPVIICALAAIAWAAYSEIKPRNKEPDE